MFFAFLPRPLGDRLWLFVYFPRAPPGRLGDNLPFSLEIPMIVIHKGTTHAT
jgi:hypothetical protein